MGNVDLYANDIREFKSQLTFKILDVPLAGLSKSLQKDLEKNGQRTDETIQIPGVLLAQWSKNYSINVKIVKKN